MAKPRDPAITEYVRTHIRPMLRPSAGGTGAPDAMTGKEMAERVGTSPAFISGLVNDKSDRTTGVGGGSVEGFARILGFATEDDLRTAAYNWWQTMHAKAAVRLEEPNVVEAIRVLRGLYPLVSEERWNAIAARFDHQDFAGRSVDYWITAFGQEVAQDAMQATRAQGAKEQASKESRREATRESRVIRDGFVAAQREKKTLQALRAPVAGTEPEPEPAPLEIAKPLRAERRR